MGSSIAAMGPEAARHALKRLRYRHAPDIRSSPKWRIENSGGLTGIRLISALKAADEETSEMLIESGLEGGRGYIPSFVFHELLKGSWMVMRLRARVVVDSETNMKVMRAMERSMIPSGDFIDIDLCVVGKTSDFVNRREHVALAETLCFALEAVAHVRRVHGQPSVPVSRRYLPVTCILGRRRRCMPKKGVPPDVEHVNAGVTSLADGRIIVYRAQHVHKVLIHEIIHSTGMDADIHDSGSQRYIEQVLREQLRYDSVSQAGLRCYEAYVETLACFWNMYRSTRYGRAGAGTWKKEKALYMLVSALLWTHQQPDRREATHVLAYYHGKAALWDRLAEVPIWPRSNDGTSDRFWMVFYDALRPGAAFWQELAAVADSDNVPVSVGAPGLAMTSLSPTGNDST